MKILPIVTFLVTFLIFLSCASIPANAKFPNENTFEFTHSAEGSDHKSVSENKNSCVSAIRSNAATNALQILLDKGWVKIKKRTTISQKDFQAQAKKQIHDYIMGVTLLDVTHDSSCNVCTARIQIKRSNIKSDYESVIESFIDKKQNIK